MAEESPGSVALLSLHPRFARAILEGDKTVELRRVKFARPVTHVVLYATAPVGKIVGWARVDSVNHDATEGIWSRHGNDAGVSRSEFRRYYSGATRATAIALSSPTSLSRPVPVDVVGTTAPQSFAYLARDAFLRLKRRSVSAAPVF